MYYYYYYYSTGGGCNKEWSDQIDADLLDAMSDVVVCCCLFRSTLGDALCRVQVNTERVGLESLVEADPILTWAGSSFHHCGARTVKSWDLEE